jgi:hypothetical protein
VSYRPDGCWVLRLDYSDNHWQNSTYCPRNGDLVEVARAGWYRWDLVALTISDTATFVCAQPEVALPAVLHIGTKYSFSCTGTNSPLKMGVVTMVGANEYVGADTHDRGYQGHHTALPRGDTFPAGGKRATTLLTPGSPR